MPVSHVDLELSSHSPGWSLSPAGSLQTIKHKVQPPGYFNPNRDVFEEKPKNVHLTQSMQIMQEAALQDEALWRTENRHWVQFHFFIQVFISQTLNAPFTSCFTVTQVKVRMLDV